MMVRINRKEEDNSVSIEVSVSREVEEKKAQAIAYFQRYISMRAA